MNRNYPFWVKTAASKSTVIFCKIFIINVQNYSKINTGLKRRKYGVEIGVLLMIWVWIVHSMSDFEALGEKTSIRMQ